MLFTTTLLSALVAVGGALAQTTPPGFMPAVNKTLDVYYGTQYITPGLTVKKSSVSKQPTIGVTGQTLTGKYLLAMIAAHHHRRPGTPRGTVLHALLQDWTPSGQAQNGSSILTTKATGPASYFGPAPPAETPKHPHNYIFLLHEQPDNFAVPAAHKSAVQQRLGINWPKFITDAGLSEPIAANYLQVQSGDNTKRFVA
ncbi:phosphatidylethanolamine-binding protein [Paraphaeosphaeria minitans]|uniref:Phosphatidylethanolamine-binding protein n=1 Tax=Paraphaeosphaeria minitans TaxID=565426 RepID=A0A9P6KLB3_9PLEO|nr:phosphatidylethanolamine-binding protein [Paraphaeosphaeria minitans]